MQNTCELIGYYGGDLEHALSAWTSTSRDLSPEKLARIPALLKMLAENGHHTPFEKSSLHFLVRTDIATHIHLLKHRIGVSINAESARYKELKEATGYTPEDWPVDLKALLEDHYTESQYLYRKALKRLTEDGYDRSRAKESARFFLPYANQITVDMMFNFRSFMHFQGLRNDPHAQLEVRELAQAMLRLVKDTGVFEASLAAWPVIAPPVGKGEDGDGILIH